MLKCFTSKWIAANPWVLLSVRKSHLSDFKWPGEFGPLDFLPWAHPRIKGWDSPVAQTHCVCPQCGRSGFDPWVGKIPWRRKWQPTPVLLPRKFHGWRSLVGYSPWGRKELDTTERLHFLFFHPGIKADLVHSNHMGLTVEQGWIPRGKKWVLLKEEASEVGLDIETPNTVSAGAKRKTFYLSGRKKEGWKRRYNRG